MAEVTVVNFVHYCRQVLTDAATVDAIHSYDDDAVESSVRRVTIVQGAIDQRQHHMEGLGDLLEWATYLLNRLVEKQLRNQIGAGERYRHFQGAPINITEDMLICLRGEGYTVVDIATKLRVSRQTIYNKINLFGLKEEVLEIERV